MSLENKIHDELLNHPKLKKIIKRVYQSIMYTFSKKIRYEGNIIKISPDDKNNDYFFGYYDKSPWDITNRYVLCMKAKDTSKNVCPNDKLDILLIDTKNDNKVTKIAESNSWNVQQGCMAQWLGPKYDKEIIYNDFRNGKYCSVILNIETNKEKVIDMPIYSVSSDGKFAFTLDFSRLHRMRPGYGYSNLPDITKGSKIPDSTCIWKVDLINNKVIPYLTYKDFYNFETRDEMINAEHKVNHIMISPNMDKFMVIHRWYVGKRKYSRLITCDIKTKKLFNLSDDNMVSHCYWKNNDEIIAFENKKATGNGYYLMKDKTHEYRRIWEHISSDGHPSYSPDNSLVVTDTYPNKKRMSTLKIMNEEEIITIGKVFSPFKYDNDTRCDLHPRWSRDGKNICIDSCHEGNRGLYVIPIDKIKIAKSDMIGVNITNKNSKYKIVYLMTACKRRGPTQQTLNIIKNLDHSIYSPILITIYEEEQDSRLCEYLPYVCKHYYINISKKDILLGKTKRIDEILEKIKPDIIHTVGLFPDLLISKKNYKQITTLRNYVYDDFPKKFGLIKGTIMAKLQLKSIKKIDETIACSKSLSNIYKEKLNLNIDYIQNGVDTSYYEKVSKKQKIENRNELNFSDDDFIFIYTGQFIERKNIPFLLDCFLEFYSNNMKIKLILLGDGPLLDELKNIYKNNNIIFYGNVDNVNYYLKASDVYISTSKSEGLPNGVLESLATGIPVILSDIPQHKEIINLNDKAGFIYKQDDKNDLIKCFNLVTSSNLEDLSNESRKLIEKNLSAKSMSNKYQNKYKKIIEGIKNE